MGVRILPGPPFILEEINLPKLINKTSFKGYIKTTSESSDSALLVNHLAAIIGKAKNCDVIYVLLDEIENEFDIKFDLDEILNIKKIGDIEKIFVKHGVKAE